jgi:hypothetical protein
MAQLVIFIYTDNISSSSKLACHDLCQQGFLGVVGSAGRDAIAERRSMLANMITVDWDTDFGLM